MPTYTNPKTGKKIKSATPLSDTQLEEAFGSDKHIESPPKNENSPIQDVLEGAGLPKSLDEANKTFSRPAFDEDTASLKDVAGRADPSIDMLKGVTDRVGRYWDKQANDNTPGAAIRTLLSAIPGIGSVMENADKAIPPSGPIDEHAMGKMAGASLATVAPFSGEIAKVMPTFSLGGLDRFSGMGGTMKDAAVAGMSNTKVFGSKFNAKGAIRDFREAQTLRNAPPEVTPTAPAVDPRVAELKDLTLNRRLAAERGQLPTTEALKLNDAKTAEPLPDVTPFVDPRQAELKDLVLNRRLAQEKGLMPQGDSVLPGADVDELKKLKLQRSLEKLRGEDVPVGAEVDPLPEDNSDGGGNSTPKKTDTKTPVANQKSALNEVETFPTRYKNVRLKGTPPPATKEVPTAPNPSSKITPHDPVASVDEPRKGNYEYATLSDNEMLTTPEETRTMAEAKAKQELLPDGQEEWQAVNNLEAAGMDRVEAMKEIRRQKLAKAAAAGDPLNSRAAGTNPRSLGTDRRGRNVNPRALDNKRREP